MSESHWVVVSGVMSEMIPITDDGLGPIEEWCDVVGVEAATRRKAIVAGVKEMPKWATYQRKDSCSPFTGVIAELAECPHGFCWCDMMDPDPHPTQGDYCEACDAEVSRQPF
ncbi:hypothetical protein LCGC14_1887810 [marine sediment metagenome]|uniref:Uncharacterized protein n=1 Tax=marine sediment metagenome TaxID=412755 RepID=A0A0F9G0J8_9ZZZZ